MLMRIFAFIVVIPFLLVVPVEITASEIYTSGFLQGLYGGGIDKHNPTASDMTASETRLQLRLESFSDGAEFFGRIDFVYDDYYDPGFELELREGFVKFRIGSHLDFKIGRQIITWGTGDLIFINDVFAKDYRSFFTGRDDQYLKAPQNALRMEFYAGLGTFSTVYTPRFTPNRIPTGKRLSYFNPLAGGIVGGDGHFFEARLPEAEFENGEIAVRFSRYVGSVDIALYAYRGFYKNPVGMDMADMMAYYPELNIFGASLRSPVLGGIAWVESGYHYSREDRDGDNPSVPNSKISSMAGFERQLTSNLTANVQYQNEFVIDHDVYSANLMPGMVEADEMYHLITARMTQLLMMETVSISAFAFISPNDEDFYGRFSISYKYTDALTLSIGANIFEGSHEYTNFGAYQKNDNVYLKVTYGY